MLDQPLQAFVQSDPSFLPEVLGRTKKLVAKQGEVKLTNKTLRNIFLIGSDAYLSRIFASLHMRHKKSKPSSMQIGRSKSFCILH
jgi:hypothetical protein